MARLWTAWIVGVIVAGSAGAEPPRITFISGFFVEYPAAWGWAVSGDGKVVVGQSNLDDGLHYEAFRWCEREGTWPLGDPGQIYVERSARSASFDGSVVVGFDNQRFEAFRWEKDTGLVWMGFLPGDSVSVFHGVSADGAAAVGWSGANSPWHPQAVLWSAGTGMVGLGYLPGGGEGSYANAVKAGGRVVVGCSDSINTPPGQIEAFLWTPERGMVGLGDLPGGQFSSRALDASEDGSVVVGITWSELGDETFRWTEETGMVGLGLALRPNGVSADGSVIAGENPGSDTACFWTERTGLVDLRVWLMVHGVQGLEKKSLYTANGISADGRTIVGTSSPPVQAFIAYLGTPCEADCNDDGALDVDDFVCFQTFFGKGSLVADCDKSGSLDIDDFVCFQTAFGVGCP